MPLFKFKHDEEAIKLANDTIYGLAAYFYTRVSPLLPLIVHTPMSHDGFHDASADAADPAIMCCTKLACDHL